MKRLSFILAFIFISSISIAQKDSIRKNHISVNIAAGLISGEVGLYYDYRLSKKFTFQLSYGHRFYNFHLVVNEDGKRNTYFPQQGDIIRIGLKKYFREIANVKSRLFYYTYRLSYWNMRTPKYTTIGNANPQSHSPTVTMPVAVTVPREVISEQFNVLNVAFGIGREIYIGSRSSFDSFFSFGVSVGQKATHKYPDNSNHQYIEKTGEIFPTLELGCKIGLGW